MWNLKKQNKRTNKHSQRYRKQTSGCQREESGKAKEIGERD